MQNNKGLIDFIFELGHLKKIRHEGWRLIGVDNPETVAAHSLRAAQIAYFLAKIAGYLNPHEVVSMVVFHDMAETRIGDLHKVANRYVKSDEESVVRDQIALAPEVLSELLTLWQAVEYRSSEAGNLAKDADLLEQAVTALEYLHAGFGEAVRWYDAVGQALKTSTAQAIHKEMRNMDIHSWWKDLKKFD